MKIAVCDDEQSCIRNLEGLLGEYGRRTGIESSVSAFTVPFDLAGQLENGVEFDLFLLDICMPGMSGIELAAEMRRLGNESPVIFLTTSADYALEAFGVGASQYLLKPFTQEAFFKALDGAVSQVRGGYSRGIVVKSEGKVMNVLFRDILYSESLKNNQYIHLSDGRVISVRMTVSELYGKLSVSDSFVRCGSAYILNLAKVKKLEKQTAVFSDSTAVCIPRGSYEGLKESYFAYYGEGWHDC